MDTEPAERLYTIQNDIYHYYTGHLSSGNQVLMYSSIEPPTAAGLPRVEFDAEGNVVAFYSKSRPPLAAPPAYTPGTIRVKAFFVADLWFGIEDLPAHYQEFQDEPENATEEERLRYPKQIAAWQASGDFVLYCNEDYYLNKEGELVSS